MASVSMQCARCHSALHSTKDCHLPYYRTTSVAERRAEAAKRRSEWEARQAARQAVETKRAEKEVAWKAKQAEWEAQRLARKQRFGKNLDVESDCSDDAASTAASSAVVIDE